MLRSPLLCVALILILASSGCRQLVSQSLPSNWPLVNLTMPANSTIVLNKTTSLSRNGRIPASTTFIVEFDNNAPLTQTRTHIENCMKKDGFLIFRDSSDPVMNVTYISPDGKTSVKLSHTSSLKGNNTTPIATPIGDYSVYVTVYDQAFDYMLDNAAGKL